MVDLVVLVSNTSLPILYCHWGLETRALNILYDLSLSLSVCLSRCVHLVIHITNY